MLAGIYSCDVCQAQVGTGQGTQTLTSKVVDGDHNAPCCLQQHPVTVS